MALGRLWQRGNTLSTMRVSSPDKSVFGGLGNIAKSAKWSRIALFIGNTNPGISDNALVTIFLNFIVSEGNGE